LRIKCDGGDFFWLYTTGLNTLLYSLGSGGIKILIFLLHDTRLRQPPEATGLQGEEFARMGAEAFGLMVTAIRQGIVDGSIRPDTPPEKLAFCASSMVDGILERIERRGGKVIGPGREEALAYAFDLVVIAVANRSSDGP
jgi:hypothetical protein